MHKSVRGAVLVVTALAALLGATACGNTPDPIDYTVEATTTEPGVTLIGKHHLTYVGVTIEKDAAGNDATMFLYVNCGTELDLNRCRLDMHSKPKPELPNVWVSQKTHRVMKLEGPKHGLHNYFVLVPSSVQTVIGQGELYFDELITTTLPAVMDPYDEGVTRGTYPEQKITTPLATMKVQLLIGS